MTLKKLLLISLAAFTLSACSAISNLRGQPASSGSDAPAATSTELPTTSELDDNTLATSTATTEASNSPAPTATQPEPTQEATQTTPAENTPTATTPPTMTSTNAPEASPTTAPTSTPTATATTASSSPAPLVSVSVGTNCRTGPGKVYDYIGELREGESAEVVGKNELYNYWIIKNPDAAGECWLWGMYANVTGDTSSLKEYAVPSQPPSAASATPAAPTATTLPATPAPTVTVSVSVGTNCRTGPGKAYDYVGELREGESAEVVGKNELYNYWIIKNPDAAGECWLWGYYATVTGDTSALPEYKVP